MIPNPINEKIREKPKQQYSNETCNFVAAGRITEQKNYPVMIEAFEIASKECPDIQLSIYGTGSDEYIAYIQKVIDDKGLSDKVKLMGRTTDMISALHNADAFLMTSDYEGMPNALAEAMAVGLPCISTNCKTGPRDLIDDGENGFLVEVGNAENIAKAIVKVAQMNAEQASEMGKKAREKVLDLCSEENSLERLIKVIEG